MNRRFAACVAQILIGATALTSGCTHGIPSPGSCPARPEADCANATTEVDVTFQNDIPIVEVRVQGVDEPLLFAIDTGAPTAIRAEIAERAEREEGDAAGTRTFEDGRGRSPALELIVLERLSVGSLDFASVPAVAVRSPVFDRFCPPVDGLLGNGTGGALPGALDRVSAALDRERGRLTLSRVWRARPPADVVLPLRTWTVVAGEKVDATVATVPVILGGQSYWAILDTGGGALSTMTRDVFEDGLGRSISDDRVRRYLGSEGVTIAGSAPESTSWVATIDDLQIGRIHVSDLPFQVVPRRPDGRPSITLSESLLRWFDMALDSRRSELGLTLLGLKHRSIPTLVNLDVREGHVTVVGLLEGGAAYEAGLRLGDELVRFGDLEIDAGDPGSLCVPHFWWGAEEDGVQVRLRREGEEFDVWLPATESAFDQ